MDILQQTADSAFAPKWVQISQGMTSLITTVTLGGVEYDVIVGHDVDTGHFVDLIQIGTAWHDANEALSGALLLALTEQLRVEYAEEARQAQLDLEAA